MLWLLALASSCSISVMLALFHSEYCDLGVDSVRPLRIVEYSLDLGLSDNSPVEVHRVGTTGDPKRDKQHREVAVKPW